MWTDKRSYSNSINNNTINYIRHHKQRRYSSSIKSSIMLISLLASCCRRSTTLRYVSSFTTNTHNAMIPKNIQRFPSSSFCIIPTTFDLSSTTSPSIISNKKSSSFLQMSMSTSSTNIGDIQQDNLETLIQKKGDEIRQMKTDGVDKATLQPHIDELLALKAKLPSTAAPATTTTTKAKSNSNTKSIQSTKNPPKAAEPPSESELRETRLQKVQAMKEKNVNPYAYSYDRSHTTQELHALYENKLNPGEEDVDANVSVAGRVMNKRVFGKLAFFYFTR